MVPLFVTYPYSGDFSHTTIHASHADAQVASYVSSTLSTLSSVVLLLCFLLFVSPRMSCPFAFLLLAISVRVFFFLFSFFFYHFFEFFLLICFLVLGSQWFNIGRVLEFGFLGSLFLV